MKKIIGYILYQLIGKHLPTSYAKISLGSKYFRRFCGKLMLEKCGKNVNIERHASFSTRTKLGDYSGIGIRAQLYGPVKIGKGSIIGAGAVVTKNVDPYSIMAGNPARKVKTRK